MSAPPPPEGRPARVLVIEDDEVTAREIGRELAGRGYRVEQSADGEAGFRLAQGAGFEVLVLDRMLPSTDGLAIASRLKDAGVTTPILMISALSDVDERIKGLRAGGDDYLVKPFAVEELSARVEVLIRRTRTASGAVLRYADVELDLIAHAARRAGRDIKLYPKELKLLEFFLRNPEQLLTRSMIFEAVWGYGFDPGTNIIDVHVSGLRRKLDFDGLSPLIHTSRRTGYTFSVEP